MKANTRSVPAHLAHIFINIISLFTINHLVPVQYLIGINPLLLKCTYILTLKVLESYFNHLILTFYIKSVQNIFF